MSIWVNHNRIKYEERLLLEKFGNEYENYMKYTGKYLPKLIHKNHKLNN
jgi:protein-S-isoprenylcysteine O-methyltransferase Ste14